MSDRIRHLRCPVSNRTTILRTWILISSLLALGSCSVRSDEPARISDEDLRFFESRIRPLLAARCYTCHSAKAKPVQGGLKLDSAAAFRAGGDSGPLVVAGRPAQSLLIQSVLHSDEADFRMPPRNRLPQREIDLLIEWVKRGSPFPGPVSNSPKPAAIDYQSARQFWSFRMATEKPLPNIRNRSWPRQRLDFFVLARMENHGLAPTPEVDRQAFIRRVSFDLTGLPPTPDEVQQFVSDSSPAAHQRLVERLLASPAFGERWGRAWLDLARYTDRTASWLKSTGQAHLYRDWVVEALNADLPYDEFVRRQLATDHLPETGPQDLPALGFLGLSPTYWKELKLPREIIKVIVADEWEERIDAVSRTFLGLTVACARCHDHKFDPITMDDYYALAGVIASCRIQERPLIGPVQFENVRQARQQVDRLQKELRKLKAQKPAPLNRIKPLTEKIQQLKQTPGFNVPMAPGVVDESLIVKRKGKTAQSGTSLVYGSKPRDLPVFIRGNPNRPGPIVPRRFIRVLARTDPPQAFKHGSGRLDLANSIVNDAGFLAARVMVNRIWHNHFGRGLVDTPSNFGNSGSRPSHPDLLDDLAARLIASDWNLKQLHREIVLSATYRQSSLATDRRSALDPDNRWLARMPIQKLSVEAWRDAMLVAAGELDRSIGGPSVDLNLPANRRRTLYGTIHRREMSTMLLTHDFPDPTAHHPKRIPTTSPLQGLYALNATFIMQRAEALAQRLLARKDLNDRGRIERAYQILYSRSATPREKDLGLGFLKSDPETDHITAWTQYTHALLASNEFLFVR